MQAIRGRYSRRRSIRFDLRAVMTLDIDCINSLQITLTLDTYSHVLPSIQEEAIGRLGELLN